MKDTLLDQRKYFNEELEKLSQIKDSKERFQRELNLLSNEVRAEFSYRSGLTRGKIIGLGLEKSMPEIVDGMNKTSARAANITVVDTQQYDSAKHIQAIIRANGDTMLEFALDYVDKWVMYNNLFK